VRTTPQMTTITEGSDKGKHFACNYRHVAPYLRTNCHHDASERASSSAMLARRAVSQSCR